MILPVEETDAGSSVNKSGGASTGNALTDVPDTEFNGGNKSNWAFIIIPIVVGVVLLTIVIVGVVTARKGKCCDCFIKTFPKLFKAKSQTKEEGNIDFDNIGPSPSRRRSSDKKKSNGQDENNMMAA